MARGIPWIVHLAAAAPALVVLAWLLVGRRDASARWLALGGLVSLVSDSVLLATAARGANNQWLAYLAAPLLFGSFLLALAGLQGTKLERQATRVATSLLVVATMILALTVEAPENFSKFAVPLGALLVFAVSLWTLVRAGLQGELDLRWRESWLWLPLGLALYSGITAAYFPLAAAMAEADLDLIVAVWKLKALLTIVAFVLMAWGIVCQSRDQSFGPSSLSSSSPSGSS